MIAKDIDNCFPVTTREINFCSDSETFFRDKDGGEMLTFLYYSKCSVVFELMNNFSFG